MDDNAQHPTAPTSGQVPSTQPAQVPQEPEVMPISTGSTPTPTPQAPMGSMHKEAGPMVREQPFHEVLQPSEQAPVLEAEVIEAGVEVSQNPEVPDLTMHDKHAGLSHAPVIAPVPTTPSDGVILPMTETEALETLKTNKNAKSGKSWIAIEVLKMIQRKLLGGGEH